MKKYTLKGLRRVLGYAAVVCGLLLWTLAVYSACSSSSTPTSGDGTCERRAKYPSLVEIEQQQIMLWADYQTSHGITLTTAQEDGLANTGDLVGQFSLDRPVKFPNGRVDMPAGWLPDLPSDHPWKTAPPTSHDTFPAYFEVRVVDPLLYDPALPIHTNWANQYLATTGQVGTMITSYTAADSSCP